MDAGGMSSMAGASAETTLELLRLYRERDVRDMKIRGLEQALAEARRVTPSGSQEETGKLAMQVQQLRDVASDRSRLVDELRSQNEAHEATIATLKASLEDSHTTIRELRQSKADILAQKPGERNADLEARNTALEDTIADLKKTIDSTTLEVAVGRVKRRDSASLPTPLMSEDGSAALDSSDDIDRLKAHIVDLSMKATRWEAETKSLHGRLTSHEEENIGLQARIKELEDEQGVSLVPEADNQQRVAELEARLEEKTAQLDERNGQLADARGDVAAWEASYNEKVRDAQNLTDESERKLRENETQLSAALVRLTVLEQDKELLAAESSGKQAELETIRSELITAEQQLEHSRSTGSAATLVETHAAELSQRLKALEHDKASLASVLEAKEIEYGATVQSLREQLQKKEEEVAAGMSLAAALEHEAGEVRDQLSAVADTQAALREANSRVQQLQRFEIKLQTACAHALKLQAELDIARGRMAAVDPLERQLAETKAKLEARAKEVDTIRAQLAAVEQRVADLGGQLSAARASTIPTTSSATRTQDVLISPTVEPFGAGDDSRVVVELKQKLRLLETENTLLLRNSPQRVQAPPAGTSAALSDCAMYNTMQDLVFSVQDKKDACRLWVTNMFHAAANTELVQSEVFLQYHTDLASRPRLPAVEFFKICETLYPGVAIELRPGPSPSQPLYVVTGMARRQVRSRGGMPAPVVPLTPTPTLVATPTPVPAPTPVTAPVTVKTEVTVEVKQEKPVMRAEKEVQFETPSPDPSLAQYTNRARPWSADNHLDFKLWLRHAILGLKESDCMRPIAKTPMAALRRYNLALRATEKIHSLGWETQTKGVYCVPNIPNEFEAFRNAEFTVDAVLEAIGVSTKVWEADHTTFAIGVEHAPLIQAWIRDPDEPALLAKFGNMTRDEFFAFKANSGPPGTPLPAKQTKKRSREDGSLGGSVAAKKQRPEGTPSSPSVFKH